jgi:hypothetical protein
VTPLAAAALVARCRALRLAAAERAAAAAAAQLEAGRQHEQACRLARAAERVRQHGEERRAVRRLLAHEFGSAAFEQLLDSHAARQQQHALQVAEAVDVRLAAEAALAAAQRERAARQRDRERSDQFGLAVRAQQARAAAAAEQRADDEGMVRRAPGAGAGR